VNTPDPAISFRAVSKWFGSADRLVHAVSRVSLDVGAGEFVSVIGPSGCGKSTLLRLAAGLLEPDRGEVAIMAQPPVLARRHKRCGFVPQQPALLPWHSVKRNVSMLTELNRRSLRGRAGARGGVTGITGATGTEMTTGEQLQMLESIGLGEFADSLPHELSGGLQQRVSIARAFALGAPVLLMDEPFSALDEITRSEMRYLLLDLWHRATSSVLFVTHSIPEAVVLSDRVVVLGVRPGRVVAVVDVPLARPRHHDIEDSPDYHEVLAEVRAGLRAGFGS